MVNEQRLIDANALIWKIGVLRLCVASLRCGKTILGKILESYRKAVLEEIDNAPTVDAVEVVRCKNCKHYKPQKPHPSYNGKVNYCCRCSYTKVHDNDFCSYGERRDGDRNG